jgi:predicted acylesterase/phospholipase RssA
MARTLDEKEMMYDVVSGISVGAINAGGLSLFP